MVCGFLFYNVGYPTGAKEVCILVMTSIWSDKPDKVALSYIMLCTGVLDIIRSMHDPALPL